MHERRTHGGYDPEHRPTLGPRIPVTLSSEATHIPQPTLPLARYRLRFREHVPEGGLALTSPRTGYLGSAWRGAFGHALRKTVCVTRLPACDACLLLRSCPYPFLFESRTPPGAAKLTRYPRTPGPCVLEPSDRRFDTENGTLNLGVTLFGSANDHLPYVVHALDSAGRQGLTARRAELDLLDVQSESREHDAGCAIEREGWTTIFEPGGDLSPVPAEHPAPPARPPAVRVRLLSPLRIKRHERLVGASDFDFRAFAGGLLRRISLLTCFFGENPLETDFASLLRTAESVAMTNPEIRWREWTRHSSRQKTNLQMGGLVGSFGLIGSDLDPFWPILWLGQWTHAGKGCSMGLGRYVLELPSEAGLPPGPEGEPWPAPSRL